MRGQEYINTIILKWILIRSMVFAEYILTSSYIQTIDKWQKKKIKWIVNGLLSGFTVSKHVFIFSCNFIWNTWYSLLIQNIK